MATLNTNSIKNAVDGSSNAYTSSAGATPSYFEAIQTNTISIFPSAANTFSAATPLPYSSVTTSSGLSLVSTGTTAALSGSSGTGFIATYTYATPGANTYSAGQVVSITGFSTTAYNITGVIVTAGANSFTMYNSATGGTGGGTATQQSTRIRATRTGIYQLETTFGINVTTGGASAETDFYIAVNGTALSNTTASYRGYGSATYYGYSGQWIVSLNSGDYVELIAAFPSNQNITSTLLLPRTLTITPSIPVVPSYRIYMSQIA